MSKAVTKGELVSSHPEMGVTPTCTALSSTAETVTELVGGVNLASGFHADFVS